MNLENALQDAFEHYGAGRLDQAETVCREILKDQPTQAGALHLLGAVAMRVGKNDAAIELIEMAVASEPQNASYHANLGEAYRQTRRLDKAEAQVRRALEIDPNLASAHTNLGSVLLARDKTDEAIAAFDKAINLDPTLAPPLYNKGNALAKKGDLDAARQCFEQALKIEPADASSYFHLGALALLEDRNLDAMRMLGRALQLDPNSAMGCHELGCLFQLEGDMKNALPLHQHAVQLAPNVPETHMGLSSALGQAGQGADANKAALSAVQLRRTFQLPFEGDKQVGRVVFLEGVDNGHFVYGPKAAHWTLNGHNNIDANLDTAKFARSALIVDGLEPGRELEALPECDVIFNAIADPDSKAGCLEIAKRLTDAAAVPVINDPGAIARTQREMNYEGLHDIDGLVFPKTIRVEGPFKKDADIKKLLKKASIEFPVLARRTGSHVGVSLIKADDLETLSKYIDEQGTGPFYITEYVEYALDSGEYAKMRVQVIDGELYPNQLYFSDDWNVRGFRKSGALMLANEWMMKESERFCKDPRDYLGDDALATLASIHDVLKLDYFGIDFGRLPDGRILVFEANASMQIPNLGTQRIPHRKPCIEAIIEATNQLIERRIKQS